MASQRITFTADGVTCEGIVIHPDEVSHAPGLVICHPHPLYGGDMENNVVRGLAEAFAASSFAVLRFNFRGVGRSTGHYAEGIGEQEDAKAALGWLTAHAGVDPKRLILAGYSFGARVALAVASTGQGIGGFLVVAPPILRGNWPQLEGARGPKLFICGDRDPYAPSEALERLVSSLSEPKRLVVFLDTDHFFAGQERALGRSAVQLLTECSTPSPQ